MLPRSPFTTAKWPKLRRVCWRQVKDRQSLCVVVMCAFNPCTQMEAAWAIERPCPNSSVTLAQAM